jgi:hypothetical protein
MPLLLFWQTERLPACRAERRRGDRMWGVLIELGSYRCFSATDEYR